MARRHEVVPHRADRRARRAARRLPGLSILKQAYARALGIPVEIFVARDYAALIDAQATGACRLRDLFDDGLRDGVAAVRLRRAGRGAGRRGRRDRHQGDPGHARRPAVEARRRRARTGSPSRRSTALPASLLPRLRARRRAGGADRSRAVPRARRQRLCRRGDARRRLGRCDLRLDCRPMPTPTRAFEAARCERLEAAGIDRSSLSVVWRSALLRYGPHALAVRSRP